MSALTLLIVTLAALLWGWVTMDRLDDLERKVQLLMREREDGSNIN